MVAEKYIKVDDIVPMLKFLSDDTTCPIHIAAELDQIVELAEPVEARPIIHGKWIQDTPFSCTCSACGNYRYGLVNEDYQNFCHNCGALMDQ
jgi:hypothetical protein